MRIYVDRGKLSRIYQQTVEKKSQKLMRAVRRVDIAATFLRIPVHGFVPDEKLEDIILQMSSDSPGFSVDRMTDVLVSAEKGKNEEIGTGDLVVVEAFKDMKEEIRVTSPTGQSLPILSAGSHLVYRPPYEVIPLYDGKYHSAFLVDIVGEPGNYDLVKVLLKASCEIPVPEILLKYDNYHVRVLGVIASTPPYVCRIRGSVEAGYSRTSTRFALYALVVSAYTPSNYDLVQRLKLWQSWEA